MTTFYAYTRVSTRRQGEKGVSLAEQRDAIVAFATRHSLSITEWFEERVSAAKTGRPLFLAMLRQLKKGAADGVIIHKIDRSMRNHHDWAALSDLIDAGVTVHFANENIDLRSRGGRLSADIQAVVAADYSRNLREETAKGIRGRLKQGLLPFAAPVGYLNAGKGKPKPMDPIAGPLVREAFERYASGEGSLESLAAELYARGLRNTAGGKVNRNGLSRIFANPFYAGVIRILKTGETFAAIHEPLVSMRLFKAVRDRLSGRTRAKPWVHEFVFRGLFMCRRCTRVLTAERQKGHVYYRCHTKGCPTRTFREEALESALLRAWKPLQLTESGHVRLRNALDAYRLSEDATKTAQHASLEMRLAGVKARHDRLVDAFLDGSLDKDTFVRRKQSLIEEERELRDLLSRPATDVSVVRTIAEQQYNLTIDALGSYERSDPAMRRRFAQLLCSNRSVQGNEIVIEPYLPLFEQVDSGTVPSGGVARAHVRTKPRGRGSKPRVTNAVIDNFAARLWRWAEEQARKERDSPSASAAA